jgi:hypothetical protein
MGLYLIDQYSLLHFAVGIILYFWGFSIYVVFILHLLFELIENTEIGMYIINNYIKMWPGGKTHADSVKNSISDIIFTIIGYYISKYIDLYFNNTEIEKL